MPRTRPSPALLTAVFMVAALAARGQTAANPPALPPLPDDTANSPVLTQPATPPPIPAVKPMNTEGEDEHGDTRRIQSSELTTALVDSIPKYNPPAPEAPKPAEADAVKPRNGVIRLPKVVVREAPPPIFTNKDVMTEEARKELAMKQYIIDTKDMPGFAAALSQFLFQDNASQQYADAERASNISGLQADARAAAIGGDAAESSFIKQQSNDTYLRRSDWAPIGSGLTTSSTPGAAGGGNGN